MRLKRRSGVIKDSADGGLRLARSFRSERAQDSSDIDGHDRGDVARVQRAEMDAQRAVADSVALRVLVRARGVGKIAIDCLA